LISDPLEEGIIIKKHKGNRTRISHSIEKAVDYYEKDSSSSFSSSGSS
jgi:hypothetical protein